MDPDDTIREIAEFEPVEFELLSGHPVRVVAGRFWEKISDSDRRRGYLPKQYDAIRIYCTEDTIPRRMTQQFEMLPQHEFDPSAVAAIWACLQEHVANRNFRDHDSLEDFMVWFSEIADKLSSSAEDMADHIQHLPELCDPESFDRVDDSVFNDQND